MTHHGVPGGKRGLGDFLSRNPMPFPHTLGFFYREKMRAIHQVTPAEPFGKVLEVGGGRGGLTRTLLPEAQVTNIDLDASFARAPVNQSRAGQHFLCGDATALPFADGSFDAVTMFDVIEHIPDDALAIAEAWRVLRPGGVLLLSTPHASWRYPHHRALARWCPTEADLFAEWGHVRRGYTLQAVEAMVGATCEGWATFIPAGTSLAHDLAWAKLPIPVRRVLIALVAPYTWIAHALHDPHARGSETAACWRKSAA